jgi:hypothetical protein
VNPCAFVSPLNLNWKAADTEVRNSWACAKSGRTTSSSWESKARQRRGHPRNIFSNTFFFTLPTALYDSGVAYVLKASTLARYATLCRVANYDSRDEISIALGDLRKMDGVAPRTARDAHWRLNELGLIHISKTKPFTYRIETNPEYWTSQFAVRPTFLKGARLRVDRTCL